MSIPCGPGGRRGADTSGYLLQVQSRQKHWAAGLRALVVRGAVLVGVLPLGEPLPALPVPIGARSGQHILRQVTGRAPAHARARPGTAWRREHGGAVALAHGLPSRGPHGGRCPPRRGRAHCGGAARPEAPFFSSARRPREARGRSAVTAGAARPAFAGPLPASACRPRSSSSSPPLPLSPPGAHCGRGEELPPANLQDCRPRRPEAGSPGGNSTCSPGPGPPRRRLTSSPPRPGHPPRLTSRPPGPGLARLASPYLTSTSARPPARLSSPYLASRPLTSRPPRPCRPRRSLPAGAQTRPLRVLASGPAPSAASPTPKGREVPAASRAPRNLNLLKEPQEKTMTGFGDSPIPRSRSPVLLRLRPCPCGVEPLSQGQPQEPAHLRGAGRDPLWVSGSMKRPRLYGGSQN